MPSSGGLTFPALLLPRHGRWLSQYRKEQAWERTWHTCVFFLLGTSANAARHLPINTPQPSPRTSVPDTEKPTGR